MLCAVLVVPQAPPLPMTPACRLSPVARAALDRACAAPQPCSPLQALTVLGMNIDGTLPQAWGDTNSFPSLRLLCADWPLP